MRQRLPLGGRTRNCLENRLNIIGPDKRVRVQENPILDCFRKADAMPTFGYLSHLNECLGDHALTPRSRRRRTTPPHSRSSNRLKQETARPPQFPQDDPSSPRIRDPNISLESLGIPSVDLPRAQPIHPDIPALQFVETRVCE